MPVVRRSAGGIRVDRVNIRSLERDSIVGFLMAHRELFRGHVCDWGCGLSPYRSIVEQAGARYTGYDDPELPGSVAPTVIRPAFPPPWNAIVCTQVIQYVPNPQAFIRLRRDDILPGGALLMTGPTNWPIVEKEDRWRLTPEGIGALLEDARFAVVVAGRRAEVEFAGERWPLGWWAVGVKAKR